MTEKQKLLHTLELFEDDISIESILYYYFREVHKNFPAHRMNGLIQGLGNILGDKILDYERVCRISNERATYLKSYLEGKMYKDEESAKANVDKQVCHAQMIIDAVNKI